MRVGMVAGPRGMWAGRELYRRRIVKLLAARHEVFRCHRTLAALPPVDVLHVLDMSCHLRRKLRSEANVPLVVDLAEDCHFAPPWRPSAGHLTLLRHADAVVVHTERQRAQIPHRRTVVVPLPAEPQPARERRQTRGRTLRILFAEGHAVRGGVRVLGQALRLLGRTGARIEVRIAGPDRWYLHAATWWCMRGVRSRFVGELFDVEMDASYRWADMVALPRNAGASTLVAQGALLRGVPVVAGEGEGLEDLFAEAGGGVLVDPGDYRSLADGIRSVARDYPLWCRRAEGAAHVLEASRSPAATLQALERAYELAIGRRRSGYKENDRSARDKSL